jgi:prepilin-type N-terminal cleavage/methylation domain-containing protein/prepilin-type processing-associated H-X9-DG protein
MMMGARRRRGFTLIELLVVIAIIGILAAMLFPVFARARESARKTQCLANVKNIAMAFQIYFTDYDRFPPAEHRAEVLQFFADKGCDIPSGCCSYPTLANPYLRWPVILEEYTKSREIWRCPSARGGTTVYNVNGHMDWFAGLQEHWPACVCSEFYPNGWGGTATDTLVGAEGCPGSAGTSTGAMEVDYVTPHEAGQDVDKSMSAIQDATRHIVVAERSYRSNYYSIEHIAYPEICRVMWGRVVDRGGCNGCTDYVDICTIDPTQISKFWSDGTWRNKFTRHMGGNNLGFADGHARWWPADAMMAAANADPQQLEPVDRQSLPPGMSY